MINRHHGGVLHTSRCLNILLPIKSLLATSLPKSQTKKIQPSKIQNHAATKVSQLQSLAVIEFSFSPNLIIHHPSFISQDDTFDSLPSARSQIT